MSLPPNPQAQLVAKIDSAVAESIKAAEQAGPQIANEFEKAKLDAKLDKLGAGFTSGFNQAVAGAATFNDQIKTGMGNVAGVVTNKVGDGSINSLTSTIGSFGNAIGDVAEGVMGAAAATGKEIGALASKLTGGNLAGGASSIASAISEGAGKLNDFLSLKRGANLPEGGELFQTQGEGIQVLPANGDDWRVRIGCDFDIFKGNKIISLIKSTDGVVFPILPEITFSTKANYTSIDPVHNNYPFQAYKNSQVDEINISGTFVAEKEDQAAYWIAATTFFKTVTKMFFGKGAHVGAPPPVCILNGYGASIFDNVPVVVKSFSVDFSEDVNYIRCNAFGTGTWVPITSTINVTVQPVYNRRNLRQFSLQDYAKGNLKTPGNMGYL
jgi:hypothetical protein